MPMTPYRLRVLVAILDLTDRNGYCPTYLEVAKECQLRSLATIHKHVLNLVREGYLDDMRKQRHGRQLVLTDKGVKAVGGYIHKKDIVANEKEYRDALIEIANGLTTDMVSRHVARNALGWEK